MKLIDQKYFKILMYHHHPYHQQQQNCRKFETAQVNSFSDEFLFIDITYVELIIFLF